MSSQPPTGDPSNGSLTPRADDEAAQRLSSVRSLLLQLMQSARVPVADRAKAGNALAILGDSRFEARRWFLPAGNAMGFVRIDAGPYSMGNDAGTVNVPTFFIARFPTTVAQFRAFVSDSGLAPGDQRCLAGFDNHPVSWVSWPEALAYCRWLDGKLKAIAGDLLETTGTLDAQARDMWTGLKQGTFTACLPSEPEWEKAARGSGGTTFPWGDDIDPGRANYKDTGLNSTSSVGTFLAGASPYNVLDMAGNVWCWLRTVIGESLEKPMFGPLYNADDGRERLDAPLVS